jgi:hypothetical protein
MLRDVLYMMILTGGGKILESFELLPTHEAFLVAGIIAVVAALLLEPSRHEKMEKGFIYFAMVISLYGFLFKLPALLEGRLNYYLIKLIALALMGTVLVAVYFLTRRVFRPAGASLFR